MSTPISELLANARKQNKITYSYEYFPPKTDAGVVNLSKRVELMLQDNPMFLDMTWGAGGGTSDKTLGLCHDFQQKYGGNMNMHLTCTNMPAGKVDDALNQCRVNGIRNICALRGDPPEGEEWRANPDGFKCALDLIRHIKQTHGDYFCISCAGYPEAHPNKIETYPGTGASKESYEEDQAYLKEKVDAGASVVISQLFYDVDIFLRWVGDCRRIGINVPILPGLLPFTTYAGFQRMTGFCKTMVPPELAARVEAVKDDANATKQLGIDVVAEMCQKLIAAGIMHLHFYTLNAEASTWGVLRKLGIPLVSDAGSTAVLSHASVPRPIGSNSGDKDELLRQLVSQNADILAELKLLRADLVDIKSRRCNEQ